MPKEQINHPEHAALLLIPSDGGYEERPWSHGDPIPEGAKVLVDPILSVHWRTTEFEPGTISVGVYDDAVDVAWADGPKTYRKKWDITEANLVQEVVTHLVFKSGGRSIVNVDRTGFGVEIGRSLTETGFEVIWREPDMKFGTSGVQVLMTVPVPALKALVESRTDDVVATSIVGRDMTREEINKMIRALRTARDRAFGKDA